MATDRRGDTEGLTRTRPSAAVILDSNFLFIPLKFGVDIFEELNRLLGRNVRCIVTTPIIDELKLLTIDAKPPCQSRDYRNEEQIPPQQLHRDGAGLFAGRHGFDFEFL